MGRRLKSTRYTRCIQERSVYIAYRTAEDFLRHNNNVMGLISGEFHINTNTNTQVVMQGKSTCQNRKQLRVVWFTVENNTKSVFLSHDRCLQEFTQLGYAQCYVSRTEVGKLKTQSFG